MFAHYYSELLAIHGMWRWIVLSAGTTAVVISIFGLSGKVPYKPAGRIASILFISAIDIQIVLGVLLGFASPIVRAAWGNIAAAMKQHEPRFFGVEHFTAMLIAVTLAHVGSFRCRRVEGDRAKHMQTVIWYGSTLVVILAGIPWWRPLFRSVIGSAYE
jgi:hypothetical protein